jgi:hypothetical protein
MGVNMSQHGGIYYYTEKVYVEPKELLRSAIQVCEPSDVDFVQQQAECKDWVDFEQWLNAEDGEPVPSRSWKPLANALPLQVPMIRIHASSVVRFSPSALAVKEPPAIGTHIVALFGNCRPSSNLPTS